jgi:voltage-gated potassium channel Kch
LLQEQMRPTTTAWQDEGITVSEDDTSQRTLRFSLVTALALTAASLVLGYVGYRRLDLNPLDAFFGTLQLFALDADRDLSTDSIAIGVARFTAPLALVMASVVAVTAVVGQTLSHASRLRRVRDHVVVLGLSDNSIEFTNDLLDAGESVVVVEIDGDHPGLAGIRRSGGLVVIGDASREGTQRRAQVDRSRRVVVSTGDDGRNLRAAETAARLLEGSRESTIYVLLEDYWLHEELARTEFMTSTSKGADIDFVHRADYEAAVFIEAVTTASQASLGSEVVRFEGSGDRGRRCLIHLARRNLLLDVGTPIVADDETFRSIVEPELKISPWLAEAVRKDDGTDTSPGACLIAVDAPDGAALGRGLQTASAYPGAEVFVLTDFPVGGSLLRRNAPVEAIPAGSIAVSPVNLFAHSWVETLARARHQIYCAREMQRGVDPRDNPSITPWAGLPESLKESNRDFARAIAGILEGVPLGLAPLRGLPESEPPLTEEQMESLARNEHDRWAADLVRKGWVHAPAPKDPDRRTHPLLVDWTELAEEEREKDRDSIRAIPTMLALVGLELRPA